MSTDELKTLIRQVRALIDTPKSERRLSEIVTCLGMITAVVEDEGCEVPADVFEELSPKGRKLALAGLVLLFLQAIQS